MKDNDTILLENAYTKINKENAYNNLTGPQKLLKYIVEEGEDMFDLNKENHHAFYVRMMKSITSYEDFFEAWDKYGSLYAHTLYDLEIIGRKLKLSEDDIDYIIELGSSYGLEQG